MKRLGTTSLALVAALGCSVTSAQTQPPYVSYTQINTFAPTSAANAGNSLLTLGYGNISMSSSLSWGGAIWDYNVQGSGDLVNRSSTGTLWQSMVNILYPNGAGYVNPTEAGDSYLRGSAVLQSTNNLNVQSTKSAPNQFVNQPPAQTEVNLGATSPSSTNVMVQFNGMTIGKQITLAFNGDNNVAQYVAKVYANAAIPHVSANLPVLYLPGNYTVFSTYNAQTAAWLSQSVSNDGKDNYWSAFDTAGNCGGIVAENATRTYGVALYGCKPGVLDGSTRHFAFMSSTSGSSDPLSTQTTALMSQITADDLLGMPLGESSYTTYIVGCKGTSTTYAGAACVNSMANLYSHGY